MKETIQQVIDNYKDFRGKEVIIKIIDENPKTITMFFTGSMIDHDPDAHIMDFVFEVQEQTATLLEVESYQGKEGGIEVLFRKP